MSAAWVVVLQRPVQRREDPAPAERRSACLTEALARAEADVVAVAGAEEGALRTGMGVNWEGGLAGEMGGGAADAAAMCRRAPRSSGILGQSLAPGTEGRSLLPREGRQWARASQRRRGGCCCGGSASGRPGTIGHFTCT